MKKILLLCLTAVSVFAFGELWAQDQTLSGVVTSSEDKSPLPGVNVVLKGTVIGTVTDSQGKFTLSVPSTGGVLVFSFIGFNSREEEIGSRTTIDLVLQPDAKQLSEVVVTALGIERTKNELAYAAQKIDGDQIAQTRDNNFLNAMSGKVAGLDIKRNNSMGGSTNIVMRGIKSLSGSNQALFVIDGVPIDNSNSNSVNATANTTTGLQNQGTGGYDYGNAAADINPDDIASINVLKGAAASALYGSRASNGVIMITTKKGRTTKGLGVSFNAGLNVGFIDKSTFAKYQNKYGGGYGAYYEDASGFFLARDAAAGFDPAVTGTDLVVPMSEDASWGAPFDKNLMVYQWNAFDSSSSNYQKKTPWVAASHTPYSFFEKPVGQNYSLLLDAASDKGYVKFGYTRNVETGMLPNSKLGKNFVNFAASYKITDKITASASINTTELKGLGRYGTGYDGANGRNPMTNFRQWWQVNVDVKELKDAYFRHNQNVTWNWTDPTALKPIYWDNPYWVRYENYEEDSRNRYFGNAKLDYKVSNWLNLMGRISMDTYTDMQEERLAKGSVGVPYYSRYNRFFREMNYDFMANIDKNISKDISFKGLLGANKRITDNSSIYAITNGGLIVPRVYSLANSLNSLVPPVETASTLGVLGLFAQASLGYKEIVNIEGSIRRDEASSLPKGSNIYYYPSVSGNFIFSKLLPNYPWLTNAKLRAN